MSAFASRYIDVRKASLWSPGNKSGGNVYGWLATLANASDFVRPTPSLAVVVGLKRGFEFRQHLEQIPHQPDVRDLEARRLCILVNRHDRAGVLDAGQVLDGAADADLDVQVTGDDLAGLAVTLFFGHLTGL